MNRIIARSRIGFWTAWRQGGETLLNIRDVTGETITVEVPDDVVRDLSGDHDLAHRTARDLARGGRRLTTALPTPGLWSMGPEPEAFEYRAEDYGSRDEQERLAA